MKKPTFSKFVVFTSLFLMNFISFAQNDKAFGVRFDKDVQGDMLLIGNNILSQDNNNYTNDAEYNSNIDMKYVDIDNDASTFSSSSANLAVPNKGCVKILYAGLYWSAILQDGDRSTINTVKFKSPTGGYTDITGEVVWDADSKPVGGNKPYVCYADVTNLMDITNPNGTYTVANVVSSLGFNGGTGLSAGWSLYIVYEDLTLTSKSITSFDGFSGITKNTGTLDIPITGFRTIPVGPVRAKIAFAALEGDKPITGDYLEINGSSMSTTERPADNFFNSSVTDLSGLYTDRIPASSNTLGYDAGIMKVNNPATKKYPGGSVIKNDDTSATITLGSTGDTYFFYFTAFAVDIIAPKIVLTKVVQDNSGKDIGNTNVTLGDQLNYVIGFQNVGNDDATSLTIRDILPINIIFNYPADLMALPTGVTVKNYNAATREIIFNVDNSVVQVGDAALEIRFKVQVVTECNMLSDACSNSIDNVAYATYKGTLNPDFVLTDDPSANTNTGCLFVKKATNFLVGIDDCKFTKNEVLCTGTVTLKAANGYSSYSWSSSPTGTPVLGTSQTLTVSKVGTYYVHDTAVAPCLSIDEVVTVTSFGGLVDNPVIPFADQVVVCTSDGKKLPNIFLCGANATKLIKTNISDGSTIVWEKLNESAACPAATTSTLCANESSTCTWTQVATGPDYSANTAGQFRVTLTYPGGCFNRFYFNVFQNLLNPTATSTDRYCNIPATITIGGIGAGYEYSLDGITYQSSNKFPNPSFPVVTAGTHTVYIRQIGVANGCVFEVKDIQILDKVLKVTPTKVVQPLCFGYKGSIKVGVNDVNGQYTYTLYKDGAFVSTSGLTNALDYEFLNLDGGTTTPLAPIKYRIDVTSDNGCSDSVTVDLIMPDLLTATASLTKPFTCNDGEITVNAVGGTKPYFYFVNSPTVFQTVPQIVVSNPLPAGGIYNIDVVDDNGCKAQTSITVANIPMPVYTVTKTDIKCYGDNTGTIQFNVTNDNGYALMYSIDNGATYSASNVFTNLLANTIYTPKLKYTLGGVDCFDTKPAITLTQPFEALTASAGVSELAGCGDGVIVPKNNGKIRITNVQGGTPNYEYSFDNQSTWTALNEANKAPGTYTVYVRDANNCIFSASVTIDPEPVAPIIDVATPVDFNCDGTATSTVTITNPGPASFTYDYYLDGVINTNIPSNVFLNVPAGSHTIRVEYTVSSVPTYSNLLKETFGSGADTNSPGINPAFCWEKQDFISCNKDGVLDNGEYTITKRLINNPYSGWQNPVDHTGVVNGRYMAVDAGVAIPAGAVLYRKQIKDIIPNRPIQVRFFGANLLKVGNTQPDASLTVELQDASGNPLSSSSTGGIPKTNGWVEYNRTINPGNNTTLDFVLKLDNPGINGIDFAVDDIEVYQLPKACSTISDHTIIIPTGKAFTASITGSKDVTCNGSANGEITISAQNFDAAKGFEYSIDNGTTWNTSLTSPKVITGLTGATYAILVRPDATASAGCVKPFSRLIKEPAAVTVDASVTKTATCTTGATITAVGGGGTPAYQYELRQGATIVTAFNTNANFTNVPAGSYTVFVRDANSCVSPVGKPITVIAAPGLTATLDATTDWCYTPSNPATLVVNVTGGVGPFTYKLDGNAAINTNTFNNVAPGIHTILVTDSNSCTATITNITIVSQLQLDAVLTQDLTCLANASITANVAGGYGAPYTYTVSHNGGAATPVASFPYVTSVAGTYVFTVTDSKSCPATSTAITVTPKTTPTLTFIKTDITCNNANDGAITVTAANGFTTTYTYAIKLSSAATYTTQATNQFTALAAGTYNIKVIDSKGCEAVTDVTIVNPSVVTGSISATEIGCSATGTVPAVVTVTGGGGTGSYKYSFNGTTNFTNANTFSTSTPGSVTAYIQDANGCQIGPLSVTIDALEQFTSITITDSGWDCGATPPGGHVNIAGIGVSAPKRYSIISGPAGFDSTENSDGEFKGLAPGAYIFQARVDKTNCILTIPYTIKGIPDVIAGGSVVTPIKCFGGTGNIQFTVSGLNTHRYDYVVTNTLGALINSANNQSSATISLNNLPASNYTIVVTDRTTKCTATYTVNLTQPAAALAITSATATKVFCTKYTSQITVSATGGTPNYTYAALPAGSTATPTYIAGNVINVDTSNGTVLSWDVYVKDANGCTTVTTTPVTVVNELSPTITATVNQCTATANSFTITATGGGIAPLTYSLNGGTFQVGNTFTVTSGGPYTVRIKDGNGCITAATPLTVYAPLTLTSILNKDVTCSASPVTDAQITLTRSGGSGPFTYQFSTDGGTTWTATASISPFATSTAGNYIFRVTDANGCTMINNTPIAVTTPVPVTATFSKVDPTCNGFSDGSIKLTATAGEAPFTYSIDNGATFVNSNVFGGLVGGVYNYVVKDAKGCITVPGTITLVNPPAIVVNIVRNAIQCNTNTPGSFDINVTSGGTAPYVYKLYDNAFTQLATYTETGAATTPVYSFTGLNFGDYYITVVDANGCEFKSAKLRIETPPFLTMTAMVDSNSCATGVDVTVTTSGGTGPFRYSIFGQPATETAPLASNSYTFLKLSHGQTYFLQVKDVFNCISILEFKTPDPPSAIKITGTTSTNATCNGTSNGSLIFTVQDYDGTVTDINYEVVNALTLLPLPTPINGTLTGALGGPVSGNITTLPAGNYVLKVAEATGTLCSASYTFTISQPAQPLTSAVVSKVNANCNIGALVTLSTTGGTGPYTYAYAVAPATPSVFASGNVLTLDPGPVGTDLNWNITVRDANNCEFTLSTTIIKDAIPTINAPGPLCYVGSPLTADLNLLTTTFNGNKSYTVNGSAIATSTATFDGPGTYVLGVKDDNGCEDTVNYTIEKQLLANAVLTKDLYCAAPVNATIDVTITDGVAPYTYQMVLNGNPTGLPTTTGSTFTASVAAVGTYTFVITDSNAAICTVTTNPVDVTTPVSPSAIVAQTIVSCIGGNDGTITITAANGITPYTYSLSGTGSNNSGDTSGIYTGLPAGTYTFVVTDAKNCTFTDTVTITEPTLVTATHVVTPFSCVLGSAPQDAIVTLIPGGGTPGYTYSFDGGATWQTSASFTVNTAQAISYMVSDANGCKSVVGTANVLLYTPPTDMNITASPIYCNTPGTVATVTVNSVTGGVSPYTYEITAPAAAVTAPSAPSAAPFSFAGLSPDTYIIKVTDANGCSTTKAIEVKEADKIAVTAQLVNNVYCNSASTGAANFTISNYITAGNYTFGLTPAAAVPVQTGDVISYTGLPADTYTFTVTDGVSGCIATIANFVVSEPLALSSTSVATNINCHNDNATITVTATGGTGPYKYAVARDIDPVPATTTYVLSKQLVVDTNNGADMNWIVYVLDANGCPTNNTQSIVLDGNPTITSALETTVCPNLTGTYDITVVASGFSAVLQYSVDGVSYQTGNIITVNAPGTYNVTVKDANGCLSAATAVTILEPLILTPTVTTSPSCNDFDGVIAVATTGGSGNYSYNIDGGVFGAIIPPFGGLAVGPHTIGVHDTTNSTVCDVFVPVVLKAATPVTGFALTPTHVTCNGGTDGTITATMETPSPGVNDNPVYTYVLNGTTTVGSLPVTRPSQASPLFSGLAAGTYTVVVTSERICTDTKTITIIEPAPILVPTPTVTQYSCTAGNASNFATISIDPLAISGGTAPYLNYEFIKNGTSVYFGPNNTYTESDLLDNTYAVKVYDSNGCSGSTVLPIKIDKYIALDKVNVVVSKAITCSNLEDITVSVTSIGGIPANLEYTLVDINATTGVIGGLYPSQTNTTGTFTGLPVANYLITVKNLDTNCEVQAAHYVNEPNTFDLVIDNIVDLACFADINGSAKVTFIDRVITATNPDQSGAFTYTLVDALGNSLPGGTSPNAGPITLSNLVSGTYTITATLTNTPFCGVSKSFTITRPAAELAISETHTPITCALGDGTISATATGGWPGVYLYQLELGGAVVKPWSTVSNFTGLGAGSYTVKVSDGKCEDNVIVVLSNPTPIGATISTLTPSLSCFGNKSATITVDTVTGGSGNYLYTLETTYPDGTVTKNGPQQSAIFSGLGAGSYQVRVSDNWSCSNPSNTIVITEPTIVKASLVVFEPQSCVNQTMLTLSATGGKAPYTYSDTPNFISSTLMVGNFARFRVAVGTYHYYVKDSNGCTSIVSNDIKIDPLEPLAIKLDVTNAVINCRGESTGVIVATANGGLGNYVYTLLDDATNATITNAVQTTPGIFTQLAAGTYKVSVVSRDCEKTTKTITIKEPDAPLIAPFTVTPVICNGNGDGKIVVNASGGTGVIKYAISPDLKQFVENNTFDNLKPGNYDVIVQDVLGCYILFSTTVTEPNAIDVKMVANSIIPEICVGDKNGAFKITVAGGVEPYNVNLDNPDAASAVKGTLGQTEFDFNGLTGGDHMVYVFDKNGCTAELMVALPKAINLDPKAVVEYECDVNTPGNKVIVTVDPSNTVASDIDYTIDGVIPFQASNIFANVAPGLHYVEARHTNGCIQKFDGIIVDKVDPLSLSLDLGGLNEIVATVSGGSGIYQLTVNGEPMTAQNKFIYFRSGDYTVVLTDSYGCTVSATKYFEFIDIKIPPIFTPTGDGTNDNWKPTNTENYPDIKFIVYDRYGREVGVFGAGQSWDGRYNGTELPMGDYWYVLKLRHSQDDREFIGHFTLYR